jgi:hypothetical protein
MPGGKTAIIAMLVLLGVTVVPALADAKKERWEYKERTGYAAPTISAAAAKKAVEVARTTWRVGMVSLERKDEGVVAKVLIRNEEGPITKLRVDPLTGAPLPHSKKTYTKEVQTSKEEVIKQVEAILPKLAVGDRAWLGEHGRYWRIPLFWEGMLVSTVKVDARSGKLLSSRSVEGEEDD